MAPNNKYYVRAGAHSAPASHFIIEAIRARRGMQNPLLRGVLRIHPRKRETIQLVVVNLSPSLALNVELTFEPLPKIFAKHTANLFPLEISVIEREQPFEMDLSSWSVGGDIFGESPVELKLAYSDVAGRRFTDSQLLNPLRNLGPMRMGNEIEVEIKESINGLKNEVQRLRRVAEKFLVAQNKSEEAKNDENNTRPSSFT